MNDKPRQVLCEIVRDYGRDVAQDPKRCRGLLNDLCGEHRREIKVLVSAMEERVANDLLSPRPNVPPGILLPQLAKRLHDHTAIAEPAARWAVESWALALGVIQERDLTDVRKALERQEREQQERERKEREERERKEREERERKERREREERERQERREHEERERQEQRERKQRERERQKKERREWWERTWRERKKAWGFIIQWTITATVGFAVLYVIIPPLNDVLNDAVMNNSWDRSAAFSAMFGALVGAISGAFLGVVQCMGLEQHRITRTDWYWWILATAVGFAGGFAILYPIGFLANIDGTTLSDMLRDLDNYETFLFIVGAVFGFVLSIPQWQMLQQHTNRAALWILATTLGFGAMFAFSNGSEYIFFGYTVLFFVLLGCLLEWLLRTQRKV